MAFPRVLQQPTTFRQSFPAKVSRREASKRFVVEWSQNGRLPIAQYSAIVTELVVAYIEFANIYYRKNGKVTDEARMIATALKIARSLYGRIPVAEFGPMALTACRE